VGIVFKVRRTLGARPTKDFAEYTEHAEVIFSPGAAFRVIGLFPCNERTIGRGSSSESDWAVDVGFVVQRTDSLGFEDACRARNVVILLDEETPSALHREAVV